MLPFLSNIKTIIWLAVALTIASLVVAVRVQSHRLQAAYEHQAVLVAELAAANGKIDEQNIAISNEHLRAQAAEAAAAAAPKVVVKRYAVKVPSAAPSSSCADAVAAARAAAPVLNGLRSATSDRLQDGGSAGRP